MSIIELIEEIEKELEESPKVVFSELSKVDADKCLDIIDEIKASLPIELDRAARLLKERDKVISESELQAHKIISDAETKAEKMISGSEIVAKAEERAERIIEEAQKQSRDIRLSALNFSKEILSDCENYIGGCLEDLHAAREQLSKDR